MKRLQVKDRLGDARIFYHHIQRNAYTSKSTLRSICPKGVQNRKNIHIAKQPDEILLTCYLFGILISCISVIGIYRLSKSMFDKSFPSRTLFLRTINNLKQTIELMNQGFLKANGFEEEKIGIIDSLPVALCQPIRIFRAKEACEIEDIGYNVTKKSGFMV